MIFLNCIKCGKELERTNKIGDPVCFSCKKQARIDYLRKKKKKAREVAF